MNYGLVVIMDFLYIHGRWRTLEQPFHGGESGSIPLGSATVVFDS